MVDQTSELAERIVRFLDTNHVVSLATAGSLGPHAASLFYVRDGFGLVWVSDPNSRHARDLEADARVSATVAPDTSGYALIRGAQIHGTAYRVTDLDERGRLLALLVQRYSFLAKPKDASAKMASAFDSAAVYRLEPARVVLIDNSLGFGHKDTLALSD
jgi:uncharacterized protein YhbP (UPF0306 family)